MVPEVQDSPKICERQHIKSSSKCFNFYVYNYYDPARGVAVQIQPFGLIPSAIVTLTAIPLHPWGRL